MLRLLLLAMLYASCAAQPMNPLLRTPYVGDLLTDPTLNVTFHGGVTMEADANVYLIYYGNFSAPTRQLLQQFVGDLGKSDYWKRLKPYNTGNLVYAGNFNATADKRLLTIDDVRNITATAIQASPRWRRSAGAGSTLDIYMVLSDREVDNRYLTARYCYEFCGWHDHFTFNNKNIKVAWLGSAMKCPGCTPLTFANAPNNDIEADAFTNIMAHELAETATDPNLDAWGDGLGNEIADKCVWNFGTTHIGTPKNAKGLWNEKVGNGYYLLQNIWDVNAQACA